MVLASRIESVRTDGPQLASSKASVIPPQSRDAQSLARSEGIQVELIMVRSNGFEPTQVTRPKGPVVFAVVNRSGLSDLTFALSKEHGNRVHDFRHRQHLLDTRELMDLSPGEYILSEQSHPTWACHLTVTPQ